jgi:hypothetical protein
LCGRCKEPGGGSRVWLFIFHEDEEVFLETVKAESINVGIRHID